MRHRITVERRHIRTAVGQDANACVLANALSEQYGGSWIVGGRYAMRSKFGARWKLDADAYRMMMRLDQRKMIRPGVVTMTGPAMRGRNFVDSRNYRRSAGSWKRAVTIWCLRMAWRGLSTLVVLLAIGLWQVAKGLWQVAYEARQAALAKAAEAASETASERAPEPASETVPETVPETVLKTASEHVTELRFRTVTKPASEHVTGVQWRQPETGSVPVSAEVVNSQVSPTRAQRAVPSPSTSPSTPVPARS